MVLCSCTAHRQFHTDFNFGPVGGPRGEGDERVFEAHGKYLLAHVEFDDQGKYWETDLGRTAGGPVNQIEALEAVVKADVAARPARYRNGAVFVAYAHGWRHGARDGDSDLVHFRELLEGVADEEQKGGKRPVIGVYLSWRGGRVDELRGTPVEKVAAPVLAVPAFLTYWDRKETAHHIGTHSFGETLTRLYELRNHVIRHGEGLEEDDQKRAKTRLIAVGHSFGGAALFSAVSRFFEDELIRVETGEKKWIKRRWDLVLLVNPAFEALRYETIHRYTARIDPAASSPYLHLPRMLVVSAGNDGANHFALPVGQTLGDLLRPKQRDNPRLNEEKQLTTALGFHDAFRTHRLIYDENPAPGKPRVQLEFDTKTLADRSAFAEADYAPTRAQSYLRAFDPVFVDGKSPRRVLPFMVARTDDVRILDGHTGIWRTPFRDFVIAFLAAREEAVRGL
ncbi:MAG: hypothetical protein KDM91_12430 [Verrucomicrobiae bacterium]|nr:hypothetical protein [Verrucomicrobiae bacterium]